MVKERENLGSDNGDIQVFVVMIGKTYEDLRTVMVYLDEKQAVEKSEEINEKEGRFMSFVMPTVLQLPEDTYVYRWRESGWSAEKQRKWEEKKKNNNKEGNPFAPMGKE